MMLICGSADPVKPNLGICKVQRPQFTGTLLALGGGAPLSFVSSSLSLAESGYELPASSVSEEDGSYSSEESLDISDSL